MASNSYKRNQAIGSYRSYLESGYYDINQAYANPSYAKIRAFKDCWWMCKQLHGTGLKVISKNTFVFTAGFEFVNDETGEVMFMYITPNYNYAVGIGECMDW